ncbi:MAG: DUF4148 domain-containing protein [Aquincola tertiaricarbonis]|uniref:DUF4148 domain-containing protein n=1 Tax=Aquincola TaxID=391952 RepID=UPI00061532F9|nr:MULTISPECIES: DUF4148 domain-containing protein [Aquincola]MCR5865507.1 DUF4148 domain-containing protein [Aquincola sp. J276]
MNSKTIYAAALAAGLTLMSGATFAQAHLGDTYGYTVTQQEFKSTKTRAQVQAELLQARANGELRTDADGYGYLAQRPAASERSRAEVRAETINAMKSGALSQGQQALYSRG